MKRKFLGVLALAGITVTGITLASCGGNDAGNKNEVSKDIYGVNEEGNVIKGASCGLLFKQNSDIPYISLGNGVEIMTLLRSESLGSGYKYSIEKSGDNYVISNEAGAKCTIDPTNQTMAYDDYDKFIGLNTSNQAPLSMQTIKTGTKAIKEVSHNRIMF